MAARPFPDAVTALRCLRSAGLRLGILTNGPSSGQRHKLVATGLAGEVDDVFISEEIGVGKPDERAFRIALEVLGAQPSDSAMSGIDSRPTSARQCGSGCAACCSATTRHPTASSACCASG